MAQASRAALTTGVAGGGFNAQAVKPEGGFCPAAGSGAALRRKAAAIGQRRPRGLGIARSLIRFFDTLRPELLISEAPQPRRPR